MRYFTFFVRIALLFTVPSLALCPKSLIPNITVHPPHAILDFINSLETDDLSNYSVEELDRINHLLAYLARQGLLPGEVEDESILENDIQELLEKKDNSFEYAYSSARDYVIVPFLVPEALLYKNEVQKKYYSTKKFVKEHKKALIIGTTFALFSVATAVVISALTGKEVKNLPETEDKSTTVIPVEVLAIQEAFAKEIAEVMTSMENRQQMIAACHKKIDTFFSTDQAKYYTGIHTFPRPPGIPEDFVVTVSEEGAGMKYQHPKNAHTFVKVIPGKPHSPFPSQQKPYVNQKVNGKFLDKHGNVVSNGSREAHIPLEEFIYKGPI